MKAYRQIKRCRICKANSLKKFFSLGKMPSVNNFLTAYQLKEKELFFPLNVCFCQNCGLVQLAEVVNPKIMFRNYLYISSFSKTMLNHFSHLAIALVKRFHLGKDLLVVEIGSNDGTLLGFFKKEGVKILGVDPAKNLTKIANSKGLETIDSFFNKETALKILRKKGEADIIIGTNVIAHIDNLDDVVAGIQSLLKDNGVFVAEFPYLIDLIEKNEFDTIYHEHLSYFSLKPLDILFHKFNLELFDVEKLPVHGGSIRIFVRKKTKNGQSSRLKRFLTDEEKKSIYSLETYIGFTKQARKIRTDLVSLLLRLKKQNKKIVGFGIPAKGVILLNFCQIGPEILDYLVDNIPYKQGLYSPGTHIQIFPEDELRKDKVDYILILPWNFSEEILKKLSWFRKSGGRIIIPNPSVTVI